MGDKPDVSLLSDAEAMSISPALAIARAGPCVCITLRFMDQYQAIEYYEHLGASGVAPKTGEFTGKFVLTGQGISFSQKAILGAIPVEENRLDLAGGVGEVVGLQRIGQATHLRVKPEQGIFASRVIQMRGRLREGWSFCCLAPRTAR
jgi:hypothetical protein